MKYIDAERLKAEVEKRMHICDGVYERDSDTYYQGKAVAYQETLSFITSLQQEQNRIMKDYPYMPGWRLNKENNKPAIKHSILMLTTHDVAEGEWNGNEWIQYRWSCKVNDSDVLYWMHLEDLTQLEKEGDFFQQEQPEVDLEKEIKRFLSNATKMNKGEWRGKYPISDIGFRAVARHFYELGLNAKNEE